MSQNSSNKEKIRRSWIEVLSLIWKEADWKKIAQNQKSTDVFEHRLRVAGTQSSIQMSVRKLCRGLSLQAPEIPMQPFEYLIENKSEALKLLREEDIYLTLKAKETVDSYYDDERDYDKKKLSGFVELEE